MGENKDPPPPTTLARAHKQSTRHLRRNPPAPPPQTFTPHMEQVISTFGPHLVPRRQEERRQLIDPPRRARWTAASSPPHLDSGTSRFPARHRLRSSDILISIHTSSSSEPPLTHTSTQSHPSTVTGGGSSCQRDDDVGHRLGRGAGRLIVLDGRDAAPAVRLPLDRGRRVAPHGRVVKRGRLNALPPLQRPAAALSNPMRTGSSR